MYIQKKYFMYYNKFRAYKVLLGKSFFLIVFLTAFVLDLLYSNKYLFGTSVKVPVLFFGVVALYVIAKLFYKYFLSSLRTNNFNYDV